MWFPTIEDLMAALINLTHWERLEALECFDAGWSHGLRRRYCDW